MPLIRLIAALLAGALLSAQTQAADLLQVYRDALLNDAKLSSARAAMTASQERLAQGRAGLLPQVNASGAYTRVNEDRTSAGVTTNSRGNTSEYRIALSQPLLNFANWESYQKEKLSAASSEARFEQAKQDLIVRAAQAYFDVLAAEDALETVRAQKRAIAEQLASAKRNFEVGTATITDTNEAQARFDLTVAQELAAQSDLNIKQGVLQQVIGRAVDTLATLRPGVQIKAPEPASIENWVVSAERQNFAVLSQQLSLEVAKREIKRTRAGHYPTVDLVASHNRRNNGVTGISGTTLNSGTSNESGNIGVQVSIPLFSGFAVQGRVREAIALEDKARFDLEEARRTAAQSARQSFLGVNSGLAQVKALEAAEISSQSALESNRLGYEVGVRINIDVLNAQQQLFATRSDLARARYDAILNGLRLKAATGTLTEEDVVQVNGLLKQ